MALTEWPTKTTRVELQLAADLQHVARRSRCSDRVLAAAVGREVRAGRRRRGRRGRPGSSSSKAGATNRHMFWSQPKPWAKTMGWPSGRPETWTLFFEIQLIA